MTNKSSHGRTVIIFMKKKKKRKEKKRKEKKNPLAPNLMVDSKLV